jgi:hypothetical protein
MNQPKKFVTFANALLFGMEIRMGYIKKTKLLCVAAIRQAGYGLPKLISHKA